MPCVSGNLGELTRPVCAPTGGSVDAYINVEAKVGWTQSFTPVRADVEYALVAVAASLGYTTASMQGYSSSRRLSADVVVGGRSVQRRGPFEHLAYILAYYDFCTNIVNIKMSQVAFWRGHEYRYRTRGAICKAAPRGPGKLPRSCG